ncbi:MAG TPA: hypothetical protein VE710_18470 [Candidatus Bathyarchaeia archaeon]|nr:hypothetical protein [Candidatus Bathyarchaeia archaeon]
MAETLRQRLVRSYAYNIYIDGTRVFDQINSQYHEEIKQYAAIHFTVDPFATAENPTMQLDKALANGWISQLEYDQTKAYMAPTQNTEESQA